MCVVIHNGCAESLSAEYIVGVYVKKEVAISGVAPSVTCEFAC